MRLEHIKVWRDEEFRETSFEMALDHAALEHTLLTGEATARFYTWKQAAVTVGYFHESQPSVSQSEGFVRRYTGGGLVEHGNDLTFCLTFPSGSSAAKATSAARYRWIHTNLAKALRDVGYATELHSERFQNGMQPCFEHAVTEDLIDPLNGKKICGGAQRRCQGAVIHQGSIRLEQDLRSLKSTWIGAFLNALSRRQENPDDTAKTKLVTRATAIQSEKYANASWNHRR